MGKTDRIVWGGLSRVIDDLYSRLFSCCWCQPLESASSARVLQKLVLPTLVVIPTLIGEIEQDYLYWPSKYRGIAKRWRASTAWGELFDQYQQQGYMVG